MNYNRKIHMENIVKEETMKANDKLGFLNNITPVCIKKGLTSSEYIEVYEGVIRNIMQICDSRLKNSFANKRRYKEETKKTYARALSADEGDPNSF